MIVDLVSFGFTMKKIPDANYVMDVRFLNNPFYVDELRDKTGLDKNVIRYFKNDPLLCEFLKELYRWVSYILKLHMKAQSKNEEKLVIAIGCTGGQHRSPYVVENLASYLLDRKLVREISIYHRELKKYNICVPV